MSRLFWIGLGVVGLVYLSKKGYLKVGTSGVGLGPKLSPKLSPAQIGANEQVTASSYRILASRRPGLQYVQATGNAGPGQTIGFAAPSGGRFTRNVVVEGGQTWAEIAA